MIADYFLKKLKQDYSTPDHEPFCFFIYDHETIALNPPDNKYAGHFLGMLKILCANSNVSGVFVRPHKLGSWLLFGIFDQDGFDINNVPDYARDPKDYTFIPGWWTTYGKSAEVQYLLVVHKLIETTKDQSDAFMENTNFYLNETIVRLDLDDYDPFNERDKTYCSLLFHCDLANLKYGYIDAMDELGKLQLETIHDKASLGRYIWTDINKNHIDIQDPINVDSKEITLWLSWLSIDPTQRDIETGVLILNRVISFCKRNSKTDYAVKLLEKDSGAAELVIAYWSKDHLKNYMMKFIYYTKSAEKDGEEGPATKKRKLSDSGSGSGRMKKFHWYDAWMESPYRGECDGKVFAPWSLKNPIKPFRLSGNEYINNRTINEFTGYNFTYEECKAAFMSKHGAKCITYFRELIERVFCGNNAQYYEFVHKWFAFIVQHPDMKTKVAIIIKSQMGAGKGFTGKVLSEFFGKHYYLLSGTSPAQKFNGFLYRKKIIFIDEASAVIGDMAILNSLITEEKVAIETKGVDQRNETNLVEFIGATNEQIRIKVGSDTRRWVIIEAPTMELTELHKWKEHMSKLYDQFFEDKVHGKTGVKALMYYYLNMDIQGFIPFLHAPKTEAIKKCMEYSLSSTIAWWKYTIERRQLEPNREAGAPLDDTFYTWNGLFNKCRTDSNFEQVYGGRKFILTEGQFKSDLESIAVINYFQTGKEFKFRPWKEQCTRWSKVYPDIPLCTAFNTSDIQDVFTQAQVEKMEKCTPIPGISTYSDKEKDYIITRLTKQLEEKDPNTKIVFNTSFYSRKPSELTNKDIIEFD